ncbi:MAG TPA: cation:proton antiporter [Bdellovibrionales bacterium]|nr:cation:proton antiporter [Bdellovibrionales bacterium]
MHGADLLKDIGLSIIGAAALGLPAYLLKAPLLLAYLAAGVLLGPSLGFGLIKSAESISTLSSIGLVLLMFILGLEINLTKLLQAGKAVAVNGITQFLGCAALAFGFFGLLGYKAGGGNFELVYLAVACSLSSTLIVVKVLSDRMEIDTLTSRITLGILVLQDLWAITFLAIQPNLNDLQASVLAMSLGRGALLVVASWLAARFVLPVVFARVAKSPELMLVMAIAWCCAVCGLASTLHLSLEMGGLIAGVTIASFPYHAEIAAKVSSLRDFFITLFFVALGLQIPYPTASVWALTGLIVGFVLVSRFLTMFPVLYGMKYGNRGGLIPALNLSQVSEFSLVLVALGVSYGHVRNDILSAFVLALVITALLSSVVIPKGHSFYRLMNPLLEKLGLKDTVSEAGASGNVIELHPRAKVVLLGFYREGSSLLFELLKRQPDTTKKNLFVVDFNPEAHQLLKNMGIHCMYGDISHSDTLKHLELEHAEALVCTIPDHQLKGTSNLKLLRNLRSMAPEAKVIVTAETFESAAEMYAEGAAYVFLPRMLAAQHLADVLEKIEQGQVAELRQSAELFTGRKEVVG